MNIDKPLVLKGIVTPIADAGGNKSAIAIAADSVKLDGFAVTNSSLGSDPGINVASNGNTIMYNIVRSNKLGIWLRNTQNNRIENNRIIQNQIGIELDLSNNNFVSGNAICDNQGNRHNA